MCKVDTPLPKCPKCGNGDPLKFFVAETYVNYHRFVNGTLDPSPDYTHVADAEPYMVCDVCGEYLKPEPGIVWWRNDE